MENRIIFVAIDDGSLIPLTRVKRILPDIVLMGEEQGADRLEIKGEESWTPCCDDGTFARSLRVLNITDSQVYWTGFSGKTTTEGE